MWTHTYTQLLPVELLTAPLGSRLAGSAYGYRSKDVPVRLRLQSVRQASYIQCGLLVHSGFPAPLSCCCVLQAYVSRNSSMLP